MEETFITHLRQELQRSDYGSKHGDIQIWYNEAGDCIQFKTTDHIATRGKRIDEYLTLYVAIEDENDFALIQKLKYQPIIFYLVEV